MIYWMRLYQNDKFIWLALVCFTTARVRVSCNKLLQMGVVILIVVGVNCWSERLQSKPIINNNKDLYDYCMCKKRGCFS